MSQAVLSLPGLTEEHGIVLPIHVLLQVIWSASTFVAAAVACARGAGVGAGVCSDAFVTTHRVVDPSLVPGLDAGAP